MSSFQECFVQDGPSKEPPGLKNGLSLLVGLETERPLACSDHDWALKVLGQSHEDVPEFRLGVGAWGVTG